MQCLRRFGINSLLALHGRGNRYSRRLLLGHSVCRTNEQPTRNEQSAQPQVRWWALVNLGSCSCRGHGLGKLLFSRLLPVITSITYGEGAGALFTAAMCFAGGAGAVPVNSAASITVGGLTFLESIVLRNAN